MVSLEQIVKDEIENLQKYQRSLSIFEELESLERSLIMQLRQLEDLRTYSSPTNKNGQDKADY
jgi:flagellar biosynthesis/type III secretory pathway chaperone